MKSTRLFPLFALLITGFAIASGQTPEKKNYIHTLALAGLPFIRKKT
jgi:hypothetical protein